MKSMLVIGIGDFGSYICRNLIQMENEVLAIDKSEDAIEEIAEIVDNRLIADCTSKSALQQIGVSNFDVCFVCIGTDFRSNLIIVSLLKELGAKYVVSETDDEMLEKLLLNNGADEVIHPNKEASVRASVKYSSEHIFDYIHLKGGFSIYEITPLKEWVNKSIIESRIRDRFATNIIGINLKDGKTIMMPSPSTVIQDTDQLIVITHEENMKKLLKIMEEHER